MKLKVIGADYGLTWENCRGVLAQKAQKMGWALCIGAGSSRGTTNGVFPEWSELVDRLIQEDKEATKADALAKSLKHDFNADALIQAAKDRLKLSDDQFIRKLEELLYEDLKNKAGEEWTNIAKGLTAVSPAELPTHHWEAFVQILRSVLSRSVRLAIGSRRLEDCGDRSRACRCHTSQCRATVLRASERRARLVELRK